MTKKRKRWPDLQQKLDRPWCYYCGRDFDDLKILISHQKAKHFKCDRCGRRLNTAGGLSVHMSQVHKENLTHVENAIGGRGGLELEIFGMEGVPIDVIEQHNQEVTQKHFAEEAERARISGNPVRGLYGANGTSPQAKRARKRETVEEIEERAAEYRVHKANGTLPMRTEPAPPVQPAEPPGAPAPAFSPPGQGFPPPGVSAFPPGQPFFGGAPPPFPQGAPSAGPPGLPQRPQGFPPNQIPGFPAPGHNGHAANELSASLDDLIAGAAASAAPAAEPAPEKKSKKEKDKNVNLVFFSEDMSPEELMAQLPRYQKEMFDLMDTEDGDITIKDEDKIEGSDVNIEGLP